MLKQSTTPTRLLPFLLILLGSALAFWGCTDQSGPMEPLDNIETGVGTVLTGTVKDTDGLPAANAVLALEGFSGGQPVSLARLLDGSPEIVLAEKSKGIATTTSDSDGRFHFPGLAPGDYLLTSSLRDHQGSHQKINIPEFSAAAAGTTFVDIQLMPTGTLLGNAELENATDHSGTVVFIGGTSYVAITDPAGDYSLTGVPIGSWMVDAMHPGYLGDDDSGALVAAGDTSSVGDMFLALNSNIAPTATSLTATEVAVGDTTNFGAVVDDLDGVVVLCEWDFEDDGIFDWSATGNPASPVASHVYTSEGDYRAKLRVTDDKGAIGLAVVAVTGLPVIPFDAIYVSTFGNDLDDGGHLTPVKTISQGLALAQAAGKDSVMVASGIYNEDLIILNGINIIGGRDPDQAWADDPGILSTVNGSNEAVMADSITMSTVLEGLRVISGDATVTGESSVAVTVVNSSQLTLLGCTLVPGSGRSGMPGFLGNDGPSGSSGQAGMNGLCDNLGVVTGGDGGVGNLSGGDGGNGGAADDGETGVGGQGPLGGNGGPFGSVGNPGSPGPVCPMVPLSATAGSRPSARRASPEPPAAGAGAEAEAGARKDLSSMTAPAMAGAEAEAEECSAPAAVAARVAALPSACWSSTARCPSKTAPLTVASAVTADSAGPVGSAATVEPVDRVGTRAPTKSAWAEQAATAATPVMAAAAAAEPVVPVTASMPIAAPSPG